MVAVDWEKLNTRPRCNAQNPDPEFDFFTFEEAERLVGGAPADGKAMIVIGLRTGLRIGELLACAGMTWISSPGGSSFGAL